MNKILRNANIWDLHIHTTLGTPTKKNYGNDSTEKFVNTIVDIFNKSKNKMGMISFTDHNRINADAYEIFMKKSDIAILLEYAGKYKILTFGIPSCCLT